VTLLKWKLLATPQLGGASSYFSNLTQPGVHMKSWKGVSPKHHKNSSQPSSTTMTTAGADEELGSSVDCSPSSSSNNISSKGKVYSRTTNTTSCSVSGMNDISGLLSVDSNSNNNTELMSAELNTGVVPSKNSDTFPHPVGVGMGRLNPALKLGWLPGNTQPSMATRNVGLASLLDDEVDT